MSRGLFYLVLPACLSLVLVSPAICEKNEQPPPGDASVQGFLGSLERILQRNEQKTESLIEASKKKLLSKFKFNSRMDEFRNKIRDVQALFEDYACLSKDFNASGKHQYYSPTDYDIYFYRTHHYLENKLDAIKRAITDDVIAVEIEEFENYCKSKMSQMQNLDDLFRSVAAAELKGRVIKIFSFEIQKWLQKASEAHQNVSKSYELEQMNVKSTERFGAVAAKFKRLMSSATNQVYACEPAEHQKGKTYIELESFLQKYIISEGDVYGLDGCRNSCPKLNNRQIDRSSDRRLKRLSLFNATGACTAPLKDCRSIVKSELEFVPTVCLAPPTCLSRRYEFFILNREEALESRRRQEPRKCNGSLRKARTIARPGRGFLGQICIQCLCTCTYGNPNSSAKYKVSLQASVSDTDKNYVMTGVRFKKVNDVIHIQIQEGKLTSHATVNSSTVRWKDTPTDARQAELISWDFRTVDLNDLIVPANHVITGVKLDQDDDRLKLKVYYMSFDFTTGILDPSNTRKQHHAAHTHTSELPLDDKDVPTRWPNGTALDSKDGQYLRFQTSSAKTDAGQSTVPFIDVQSVVLDPPVPLSGVGLVHKGNENSAGFLALSLFTYNVTSHTHSDRTFDEYLMKSIVKEAEQIAKRVSGYGRRENGEAAREKRL